MLYISFLNCFVVPPFRDRNQVDSKLFLFTTLSYHKGLVSLVVFKAHMLWELKRAKEKRMDFAYFCSSATGWPGAHIVLSNKKEKEEWIWHSAAPLTTAVCVILCGANVCWCNCSWETRGCLSSAGMSCVRPRLCVAQCGSAVPVQSPRARCSLPE